ncbi:MAG: FKBP-type peptidyl-prolyl cis-trans isomerase [Muribaculaceae bacterium]|nr:FKBP-type peptidyl-prolyl cis-trans isomerase [Muribaculaceae bacterium]MDE5660111.1 FKBP-type peptidyl-prolyl cis-trans isomerase [Muribaculaceae bacterium]
MQKIEPGKFVAISYDLFDLNDGKEQLIHQVTAQQPETMVYGVTPHVIEPLAAAIKGLEQGSSFSVTIAPAEGFGEYREDMLRTESVPREIFAEDGKIDEKKIYPGAQIFLQTNIGQEVSAVILAVNDKTVDVKVDFNHPLAGHTIKLVGKIDEVRDATSQEIAVASNIGGCCGGGCGGGSCGDGCEGGCEGGCCGGN